MPSPALELDSSGRGGFLTLAGCTWCGHSPDPAEIAGAGGQACRMDEMGWGSWLVLGVHRADGIAVLSSKHRVFATRHEQTLSTAADLPECLGLKRGVESTADTNLHTIPAGMYLLK